MPKKVLFVTTFTGTALIHFETYQQELGPQPFIRDAQHRIAFGLTQPATFFTLMHMALTQGHTVYVDYNGQEMLWNQYMPHVAPQPQN